MPDVVDGPTNEVLQNKAATNNWIDSYGSITALNPKGEPFKLPYANPAAAVNTDWAEAIFRTGALNSTSKVYYPLKYSKSGNIDNIQIIRLGEIYLNRAEAKAQTNDMVGALEDLNTIRVRAGIGAITTSPGKDELLQLIWKERSFELAFEGHSFFDLVRTRQALTQLTNLARRNGPTVSLPAAGRQVFPIPAFDIDANKNLEQNEAYR